MLTHKKQNMQMQTRTHTYVTPGIVKNNIPEMPTFKFYYLEIV